ncbi:MAG: hypothetical protein RL434_215, partial [Pseudomonadota bacterium]
GALVRYTSDIIALGPALIASESQIAELVSRVDTALRHVA